jgi:hypothetical protein
MFKPRFSLKMVHLDQHVLWSTPVRSWHVSSLQPLLPLGQAWELELSFVVYYFSLRNLSASAHHQFLHNEWILCFTRLPLCHSITTEADQLSVLSHPHQVDVKYYPFLFGHQSRLWEWVQSAYQLHWTMHVCPEQMIYHGAQLVGLQIHLFGIKSAAGQCK